jgi:hypothetical protein
MSSAATPCVVTAEPEHVTDAPPLIHLVDAFGATACGESWNMGHAECPGYWTYWHGERFCDSCGRALCGACIVVATQEKGQ